MPKVAGAARSYEPLPVAVPRVESCLEGNLYTSCASIRLAMRNAVSDNRRKPFSKWATKQKIPNNELAIALAEVQAGKVVARRNNNSHKKWRFY